MGAGAARGAVRGAERGAARGAERGAAKGAARGAERGAERGAARGMTGGGKGKPPPKVPPSKAKPAGPIAKAKSNVSRFKSRITSSRPVRRAKVLAHRFGKTRLGKTLRWAGRRLYKNRYGIALGAYAWMMGQNGRGAYGSSMIDALQSLPKTGGGGSGASGGGNRGHSAGSSTSSSQIYGPISDIGSLQSENDLANVGSEYGADEESDDGSINEGSDGNEIGESGSGSGEGGSDSNGAIIGLLSSQAGLLQRILHILQQSLSVQHATSGKVTAVQRINSNVSHAVAELTTAMSSDLASVSSSISDLGSDVIPEIRGLNAEINDLSSSMGYINEPVVGAIENLSSIVSESPAQILDSVSAIIGESSSETSDQLSNITNALDETNDQLNQIAEDSSEMREALNPEFKSDDFGGGSGGLIDAIAGIATNGAGGLNSLLDPAALTALVAGGVAAGIRSLVGGKEKDTGQKENEEESSSVEDLVTGLQYAEAAQYAAPIVNLGRALTVEAKAAAEAAEAAVKAAQTAESATVATTQTAEQVARATQATVKAAETTEGATAAAAKAAQTAEGAATTTATATEQATKGATTAARTIASDATAAERAAQTASQTKNAANAARVGTKAAAVGNAGTKAAVTAGQAGRFLPTTTRGVAAVNTLATMGIGDIIYDTLGDTMIGDAIGYAPEKIASSIVEQLGGSEKWQAIIGGVVGEGTKYAVSNAAAAYGIAGLGAGLEAAGLGTVGTGFAGAGGAGLAGAVLPVAAILGTAYLSWKVGRFIGEKTGLDDVTSKWGSEAGNWIANNWLGEGEKTERLDAERKREIDNNYSFWKSKTSPIDSSIAKANEFASFVKSNAEELDNDCVDLSNPEEYDVDKSKHADKLVEGYQSLMGAPLGLALDDSLSDEQYAEKLAELIKPFAEMVVTPFGWSMVRRGLTSEATTSHLVSSIKSDPSVPEDIRKQRIERFVFAIGALKDMLEKAPRPAPKKFRQLAKQTNGTSANIVARVSSESGQIETEEESQNSEIVGTVSGINLKGEMTEDRISSMFGQAKDDVSKAGKDAMISAYGGGRTGKKKARAERDQNRERAAKGAFLAHEYNSLSVAGRLKWAERWTGWDDKDKYKKFLSENINPAIKSANRISQTLNPAILDEAIDDNGFILQNSDLPKGFIDELNTHQRRLDNAIIGASQTSTDVTADLLNEVKFDEFVKASTQNTPLGRLFYNRLIFANTELPKYFKQDQLDKFNKNAPFVNAYIDSYIPKIAITKKTAIESPKEALGEEVQATAEAVATESAAAESTAAESAAMESTAAESIAEETESPAASIEPTVSAGVGTESENSQIVPENTESPSTSTSDMVVDQSESTPTITAEHSDSAQLDITPQHSIVSPETDKDATAESLEMLASPLQTSNDNERLVITLLQNIIEIIKPNNQPIPEFPPQFKMDGQYIT